MEFFEKIVSGSFSPEERIWTAILPGIVLLIYFLIGLLVYLVRCAIWGQYRDAELEKRNRTILTFLSARLFFAWVMRPLWYVVFRSNIPASAITTLSIFLTIASAVCISIGRFSLGGWLFIFGGICDFLDGRVARQRGEASVYGNLLDSVLDRYSDGIIFIGLAYFYRSSWVLGPVLIAMLGSQLVSYIRAKGESLSLKIDIGLMQRPERILLLGIGLATSPVAEAILDPGNTRPQHRVAIVAIVVLAIMTQVTAARRLIYGLRQSISTLSTGYKVDIVFLRNIASAIVATSVDFVLYFVLVNYLSFDPVVATALGCLLGAVTNYTMNRIWTFRSVGRPLPQIFRYAFVSGSSAGLNASGVAILLLVPSVNYLIAWMLVRAAVFITWNFPLQKDYVYKDDISKETI